MPAHWSAAALLLIVALCLGNGQFDWVGMLFTTAGVALAVVTALRRAARNEQQQSISERWASRLLGGGTLASLLLLLFIRSDLPEGHALRPWLFGLHALAAVIFLLFSFGPRAGRSAAFVGLLVIWLGAASMTIIANPDPKIDTLVFEQEGIAGLLQHRNPYSLQFPNVYNREQSAQFYSPLLLEAGYMVVYPYPPVPLLWQVPFYVVLRDVRYSLLAATLLGALLLAWRFRSAPQRLALYAALLVLYEPMTFFVIKQAWIEPIVFLFWAATMVAAADLLARKRLGNAALLAAVLLGLMACSKQYCPLFLVPPLMIGVTAFRRVRTLSISAATAMATLVPFFLWDPREFVRDVILAHFQQPLRLDSLSLLAIWGRIVGRDAVPRLAVLGSFVAAAAVLALAKDCAGRLDRIASASAAAWLVFLFLNKNAYCNYYWLGVTLLCAACALGPEVESST